MPDEVSAVTKIYDLALWLLPHIAKFSREHRFTLGDRMEEGILEVMSPSIRSIISSKRSWAAVGTSAMWMIL